MKGIPWEVIMDWDPLTRTAWLIAIQELETGKKYNFERGEWPKDDT